MKFVAYYLVSVSVVAGFRRSKWLFLELWKRWGMPVHAGAVSCPKAHYFPIYEEHFGRFCRGSDQITMAEIGVQSGGSMLMWNHAFGQKLKRLDLRDGPFKYCSARDLCQICFIWMLGINRGCLWAWTSTRPPNPGKSLGAISGWRLAVKARLNSNTIQRPPRKWWRAVEHPWAMNILLSVG